MSGRQQSEIFSARRDPGCRRLVGSSRRRRARGWTGAGRLSPGRSSVLGRLDARAGSYGTLITRRGSRLSGCANGSRWCGRQLLTRVARWDGELSWPDRGLLPHWRTDGRQTDR